MLSASPRTQTQGRAKRYLVGGGGGVEFKNLGPFYSGATSKNFKGGGERSTKTKHPKNVFDFFNFQKNSVLLTRSAIPAFQGPLSVSWAPFLYYSLGCYTPPPPPSSSGPAQTTLHQISNKNANNNTKFQIL